jgi:tRNA pseudouridine38-40 synthase
MTRYRLTLEYDGTGYRGWQAQQNARSVQGTLREAARTLLGGEIDLQGAGRTDAGVHALGQVAHLETAARLPARKLQEGLNDLLPAGIHCLRAEEAAPNFHARHHARSRSYVYLISKRRTAFGKRYVWWVRDRLDCGAMRTAVADIRGFHDFASFADRRRDAGCSTQVRIDRAELVERDDVILFRIAASHFLWKMVRRLVGTLVEIGRGRLPPEGMKALLETVSPSPAAWTAPPSGLFLEQVLYDGEVWDPEPFAPIPLWGLRVGPDRSGGRGREK